MRTVYNMLQAARDIDMQFLFEDSMKDTSDQYVALQKEQLWMGVRSDDKEIQRLGEFYRGYAPYTKKIKEAKGQPTDRVTLKDTGDFYSGIFATADSEGLNVNSTDEKSEMLQEDYGENIFTLGSEKKGKYIELVQPIFFSKLVDEINQGSGATASQSVSV